MLDAAQMLANKGRKQEAFAKYKEVLESDPAHPEALSWVEDYLRTKRDYPQLRDVLLAAVRTMPSDALESRKERLREVAGLCEGNLRDVDGAINAWKQLLAVDRTDEAARSALTRLLEKAQRWDDLAMLLEQEATAETDIEKKISLEKKLAQMQETKRRDLGAAAEAWGRIANLTPEDERAILTARRKMSREGGRALAKAALVIDENVESVTDPVGRRGRCSNGSSELRELANDPAGAGEAFARAAEAKNDLRSMWSRRSVASAPSDGTAPPTRPITERSWWGTRSCRRNTWRARASTLARRTVNDDEALVHRSRASDRARSVRTKTTPLSSSSDTRSRRRGTSSSSSCRSEAIG